MNNFFTFALAKRLKQDYFKKRLNKINYFFKE